MSTMRNHTGIVLLLILTVNCSSLAWSQAGADRAASIEGAPGAPLEGVVLRLNDQTLVFRSDVGIEESVRVNARTVYARQSPMSTDELQKGDRVILIGKPAPEGDVMHPMVVIVTTTSGGGPMLGTIESVTPLTVKMSSGTTRTVELDRTREVKREESLTAAEIQAGSRVQVMCHGGPAAAADKEAARVILRQSADETGREAPYATTNSTPASTAPRLPPDLSQMPSKGFIHGLWLGRGMYSHDELDRGFRLAGNLGVRYFMVEFKWMAVQPEKGHFHWNDADTLDVDYVIELARKYNLSIIPYFDTLMPWSETQKLDSEKLKGPLSSRGQFPSPDPVAYAEYVYAVVDRLVQHGVSVRYIELDNEVANSNDGRVSKNAFIAMTASQIKTAENAAYDRIKQTYPYINVGSTTFSFPCLSLQAPDAAEDLKNRDDFNKAYFGEKPKPKFDFLGLHEVLSGSGNPWTTAPAGLPRSGKHDFASYYYAYDAWRETLDDYGFNDTPIMNLESAAVLDGQQGAQLLQRQIFAKMNAKKNNVTGIVVSQLSGSRKFTASGDNRIVVGITQLQNGYEFREGYQAFYTGVTLLSQYPIFNRVRTGELNKPNQPWTVEFSDPDGNILLAAFYPYGSASGIETRKPVEFGLPVNANLVITRCDGTKTPRTVDTSGKIIIDVSREPVLIEIPITPEVD